MSANPQGDLPEDYSPVSEAGFEPLPLYTFKKKVQDINSNGEPCFIYSQYMFDSAETADPLGVINGKPHNKACVTERDLLLYVREAYQKKCLVYCKQQLEVDCDTGQVVSDPIRNMISVRSS